MISNKWRILLFLLFLEIFSFTYQSHADKALNPSRPLNRKKLNIQDKNSQALNNFLEDVLTAKDELKWIDQMIYPQARRHKSHETRRRLLSEGRVASKKKKHRKGSKNSIKRTNFADNHNKHKKISSKLKNKLVVKKSIPNVKRHYIVPNIHGSGVIEYYDYEENQNKKKSNINTAKHLSKIVKKKATKNLIPKKKKLGDKNRDYKVPKELVSNQENLHFVKLKHARNTAVRKQKDNKNGIMKAEDGLENDLNSAAKVNGSEARCHRDQDDDNADDFNEVQKDFKDYQKYKRMTDEDDHSNPNFYDDIESFFLELGNTSSSGSDYEALKATDDLFKGGMEQGNSDDDNIPSYYPPPLVDYNQKKIVDEWKTDSQSTVKKKSLIKSSKSQPHNHYVSLQGKKTKKNYQKPMSNSALSSFVNIEKKKKTRKKRLNIISGPILRHESIVEPLNWPWEYYDDKDESKIRFGRGLMQVSNENNNDENSFLTDNEETEIEQSKNQINKFSSTTIRENYLEKKYRSKRNNENQNDHDDIVANSTINGKLADDIVNKIFEQVEASNTLNTGLRPGLSRKTNLADHAPAKCSPEEREQEVNRTSMILKQVGKLLNHLVAQKLQKKLCLKLSPHQRDFLIWITENNVTKYDRRGPQHLTVSAQPPGNLEKLLNQEKTRYLFGHLQKPIKPKVNAELESSSRSSLGDELKSKTRLLKRLIKQYESLSESEQIKVENIHEHLKRQLDFLQKYARHHKLRKFHTISMNKKPFEKNNKRS